MSQHVSVLLHESIDWLNLHDGAVFVDVTGGSGGHALEVFKRHGDRVRIIVLDADPERVTFIKDSFASHGCRADVFNENFRNLEKVLASAGVEEVSAVLFDLGLNSEQLSGSGKGFSFLNEDEPLLMTFGAPSSDCLTAREIVNHYDEEELANIIYEYGDERYSRRIARTIVEARAQAPLKTVGDLVGVLTRALPRSYERGRIHPATRTFQALRIAVNDELKALTEGLTQAFSALAPSGRIVVISFHSIEDRIVKNFFRDRAREGKAILHTKKPLEASAQELAENPRSRSAKFRVLEKK